MTVISLNPLPSTYHLSCLPLNYLPPSHRPSKYFHLECISSELDWKYDTHSIYTRDGSVWRLSYTLEMPPIRGCNFLYTWVHIWIRIYVKKITVNMNTIFFQWRFQWLVIKGRTSLGTILVTFKDFRPLHFLKLSIGFPDLW